MKDTVLVVEDDDDLREATADLLSSAGYDVTTASNGARALTKLYDGLRPAVILLDLMMPVLSGWGFRERQLADPELATIPVVVLTAMAGSDSTILPGIVGLIPKPLDVDILLALLQRVCQGR